MEAGSPTKLLADFVQKDQWRGHWERAEGDIPCVQQIQWNNEDRITAEELKLVLAHLLGKVENIKIFHFFTFAPSGRLQTRKLMRWSSWWTRMGTVRSTNYSFVWWWAIGTPPYRHHTILDTWWDEAERWLESLTSGQWQIINIIFLL